MDYVQTMHEWNLASMTLDGEVVQNTLSDDSILTAKDIKAVSNFVKNNSYAFDKLADYEIFDDEWKEVMIKGGNPATAEQIKEQKRKVDNFILESEQDNVIRLD